MKGRIRTLCTVLFQNLRSADVFSRKGFRERVIPAYMGLVKQIDDQMGILFDYLDAKGLFKTP
ncbi:MAG: hypothetical protein Ct9H300mP14_05130 [Gammaproteobacteria bacterium]|nr:MAG: hypothetical protein Ct9H300mP14_05130 [Gammaproteobacteria bacterium]